VPLASVLGLALLPGCGGDGERSDASRPSAGSSTDRGAAGAASTSLRPGGSLAAGGTRTSSSGDTSVADHEAGDGSACSSVGAECAEASECCSGRCDFGLCLGSTGLCTVAGDACAASAECCSGRCEDGVCVVSSTASCRVAGASCETDGDCCSGTCGDDGLCPDTGRCQTAGEPCTGYHECCTGICADPGTGVSICQYAGGCRPIGEVCADDADCCSAQCDADTEGIHRCIKPRGCMQPGEVCWTGQASNCCPNGRDGGNRLCLPSVIGVHRCFTAGTPDECLDDGQPCAFGDECCSGLCLPDQDGNLVCGPTCVPTDGACTADRDCCDGACVDGRCTPSLLECVPLGAGCNSDADCCSGFCNEELGVCNQILL